MRDHESGLTDKEVADLARLVLDEMKRCLIKRFGPDKTWSCDVREAVAKASIALGIGVQHEHAGFHVANADEARLSTFKMISTMVATALGIDFLALTTKELVEGAGDGDTVH